MKKARITTDRAFAISDIDRRIYGSFIEHMGRAVYEGIYQPESPFADKDGFRRDVLDLVREIDVPIIRYPGGNMVSAYNWEDGVGPRKNRPTRLDAAWMNIEDNSFGLCEFMDWAKKANTVPMMAVNLGTRGAADAKNLLEYCNFKGGTLYSDMRKKHGYAKPFDIKLWCLGNEMDGPWQIGHKSADEYGSLAAQTAKLMKLVDPSIELVACGSAGTSLPTFGSWDATVMEHCYNLVDYISVHTYFNNANKTAKDSVDFLSGSLALDDQIESVVAACDYVRAKTKAKKRINLSLDEWNVVYRPHNKDPYEEWTKAPHQIEDVYNLEDALLVGSLLISILNHSDRVKVACLAQLVNCIAPIMTSDALAWKQTIFYPYAQASRYGRGKLLRSAVAGPTCKSKLSDATPLVDCAVTDNEEDGELTLFLVNKDLEEDIEITSDLRQFADYKLDSHTVLNNEDIKATNTEKHPNRVKPHKAKATVFDGGKLTSVLEKHSWNVIVLKRRKS